MKLQILSFEGDKILDRKIKESSNYCDNSHLYTATFGIAQLVLSELSHIDIDVHERFTVIANVEQPMIGDLGYNRDAFFKISCYNLDDEVSRTLYQFKSFDKYFQLYVANLLLNILSQIDTKNGGKNRLAERRNYILERLCDCGFHKELLLDKLSNQRAILISRTFWNNDQFNIVFGKNEPNTIKCVEVPYSNLIISAR